MPGDRDIDCCPACGDSYIRVVSAPSMNSKTDRPKYYCYGCENRFDEPDSRKSKSDGGVYGLAKKLDDADPDLPLDELAAQASDEVSG